MKMTRWHSIATILSFLLLLVFLLLFVGVALHNPQFLAPRNLINIGRQMAPVAILAAGMTMVILTAGIDLSVGSVLGFAGVVTALLLKESVPVPLAVLLGVSLGGVLGAVNGAIVAWGNLPPFVVTLAMMTIARSGAFLLTDGSRVTELPGGFAFFGRAYVAEIPVPIIITTVLYLGGFVLLRFFRFGRYVYAIGGNVEAARLSGINTRLVTFQAYLISGACAGIAGVLLTSRVMTGDPTLGLGYELEAIAAVVIGGTSLMGGRGHILGTLLGAFIVQALNNALTLLGVTPYWQGVVKGVVILLAVLAGRRK